MRAHRLGRKNGKTFFVMADSHSKGVEIKLMSSTTAYKTVEVVGSVFASHGLPIEVVTDHRPQSARHDFQDFLRKNGVKHILTSPYHPQSNRDAEHAVQTEKKITHLKSFLADKNPDCTRRLKHKADNFHFSYRMAPNTFTFKSPSQLFLRKKH